jgi:hypothetical protein
MSNGDLDPLYKDRPITLWVEDGLTRDYLTAAWDDPKEIRLLIAGDSSAVSALVKSARQSGYGSVFGVCDRDFGTTNYGEWSTTTAVFRLQMHEIENALLAPPSLHAALTVLGRTRSESDLRTRLASEAAVACWGMALGSTLAWIRTVLQQDFPPSNGLVTVPDQAAALQRIVGSSWWATRLPSIAAMLTPARIAQQLNQSHAAYKQDLGSEAFLTSFAGKELLGRCLSWLVQQGNGPHPTESDLAKAVGSAQRVAGTVPMEVTKLLDTLLSSI